ncbi:Rrf2 family transcriptional regulator [Cohnella sp. REN36]|uniref:Rrf2 family transcriptional regulator n=1 Tax=Cohnella sp. REN36 TaxID=2887347 RepID=UPI001D13EA42|nr:Rrf2 family transcriptional regulator [Cohnella sp. REN36]MCC3374181.1 Rrf2 family transcriptional regulator [Cohnella sp. REN36]
MVKMPGLIDNSTMSRVNYKDEYFASDRIGNSVNTSPVFIRRILGQLAKAQLVSVQHGGTGAGWKLAREADAITLQEVYEAVVQTPLFELHHADQCN